MLSLLLLALYLNKGICQSFLLINLLAANKAFKYYGNGLINILTGNIVF